MSETIGSHTPEIFGFGATVGVFSYIRCKIGRHILARRRRFPIQGGPKKWHTFQVRQYTYVMPYKLQNVRYLY